MATGTTTRSVIDIGKSPVIDYNNKDWNAAKASMAPEYVYDEIATHRRTQGPDASLEIWRGWATAFPDSKGEIHNTLQSGDTLVLELTWRGTHTGPLQTPRGTIPPTGKRIELRACQINTVANGKVQSTRHYFDLGSLLQQLGLTG